MGLLDKVRYPRTNGVYLDAADRVFNERCAETGTATDIYRQHPDRKSQDRKKIRDEVGKLCAGDDGADKTKRIRARLAECVENLTSTNWYLNLPESERQLFAQHILNSTTAVQDPYYFFSYPYWYVLGSIMEMMIYQGWSGSEVARDQLKQFQLDYMDLCRQHCQIVGKIAKARSEGRELSDDEKEAGKAVVTLREATRRALSGEKVFDDA